MIDSRSCGCRFDWHPDRLVVARMCDGHQRELQVALSELAIYGRSTIEVHEPGPPPPNAIIFEQTRKPAC